MRIKITGQDEWINAEEVGITLELNQEDKKKISWMSPGESTLHVGPTEPPKKAEPKKTSTSKKK